MPSLSGHYGENSTTDEEDVLEVASDSGQDEDHLLNNNPLPSLGTGQGLAGSLGGGFSQQGFFEAGGGVSDEDLQEFGVGTGSGFPGIAIENLPHDSVLTQVAKGHQQQFPNQADFLSQLQHQNTLLQQQLAQQQRPPRPPLANKNTNNPPIRRRKSSKKDEDDTSERPATDKTLFTPLHQHKAQQRRAQQASASSSGSGGSSSASDLSPCDLHQVMDTRATKGRKKASGNGDDDATAPKHQKVTAEKAPRKKGKGADLTSTSVLSKGLKIPPDVLQEQRRLVLQLKPQIEKDGRGDAKQRLQSLTTLREKHLASEIELYMLRKTNDVNIAMSKELEEVKHQRMVLVKKVGKLEKKLENLRTMKVAAVHEKSNAELEKIKEFAKVSLFRVVKFVATPEEEEYVAKIVFRGLRHDPDEISRPSWIKTYSKACCDQINAGRNYLTQEFRKVAFKCLDTEGVLPSHGDLLLCAKRDINLENPVQVALMLWYHEKIMAKILGVNWSKGGMCYSPISGFTNAKGKVINTVENEAFAVVCWENNQGKWPDHHKHKNDASKKGKKFPNSGGKYTITTGGQHEYTSWTPEGMGMYMKYKKEIAEAWTNHPERKVRVEQDALDALRKKMRVVCADAEAERKFNASNKRKLKNNQEPAEKHKVRRVVSTLEILESDVE